MMDDLLYAILNERSKKITAKPIQIDSDAEEVAVSKSGHQATECGELDFEFPLVPKDPPSEFDDIIKFNANKEEYSNITAV